jgi:hypothetical protein
MSTLHNTLHRLGAWAYRRRLTILAGAVVFGFAAALFVPIFRLYDERQERTAQIEGLARENCEGINETNATVRFVLDGSIRNRPAGAPISDAARQLTIDTYRRLPQTDCTTGAKTYFDPPFPPG